MSQVHALVASRSPQLFGVSRTSHAGASSRHLGRIIKNCRQSVRLLQSAILYDLGSSHHVIHLGLTELVRCCMRERSMTSTRSHVPVRCHLHQRNAGIREEGNRRISSHKLNAFAYVLP